jgi:hypothetical protein
MITSRLQNVIAVDDWDHLVMNTYGKMYDLQQQDGCKQRSTVELRVPCAAEDFKNNALPEKINGAERGVRFEAWLTRDPKTWYGRQTDDPHIDLFWQRHFYPRLEVVANDLHNKGLLPAGNYLIVIDW